MIELLRRRQPRAGYRAHGAAGVTAGPFSCRLALAFVLTGGAQAQETATFGPGTHAWVVPSGVTSVVVEAWGGGGAGGGSTNAGFLIARGGAGGGGGAYASSTLTVTPGNTLTIVVADAAAGQTGATGNAGARSFVGPDTNPANAQVLAAGGSGGTGNTSGGSPAGGAGGTVAASVGDTRVAGANGTNGATGFGISSGAGGAGAQGGGSGGAPISTLGGTSDGNPGAAPGGGGGGARTSQNGGSRAGGAGGAGRVVLTFTPTAVVLGEVALEWLSVATVLERWGAFDLDADAMLRLLQTWDAETAAARPGADREDLLAALRGYLDPDGDGLVAVFRWETLEERGTVGFHVERRAHADWVRVNAHLLPGLVAAPMGAQYWLADPAADSEGSHEYRLIELEARGSTRSYGPFHLERWGSQGW